MSANVLRNIVAVWGSYRASKKMHARLLDHVLVLPMAFFDSQPLGRLLNRFTKDTEAVDVELLKLVSIYLLPCTYLDACSTLMHACMLQAIVGSGLECICWIMCISLHCTQVLLLTGHTICCACLQNLTHKLLLLLCCLLQSSTHISAHMPHVAKLHILCRCLRWWTVWHRPLGLWRWCFLSPPLFS